MHKKILDMKTAIVLLALVAVLASASIPEDSMRMLHKKWMEQHNKVYATPEEHETRFAIFADNLNRIAAHNAKKTHSYTLGMNEFGDMSGEEFARTMLSSKVEYEAAKEHSSVDVSALPTSVDWRTKGYVTPVKNQGQCGSCWSFSSTAAMEGAHFKATGKLVSLSESQNVDCSTSFGNQGCNGGLMSNAYNYLLSVGGQESEADYPYTPSDGTCKFSASKIAAKIAAYTNVSASESDLQEASATVGPIAVAIDASSFTFQFYSGGVYDDPSCSSTKLDHGVTVVGYGVDGGKDFWLVKNSWGASWGMKGYIEMSRNKNNQCGIATCASWPKGK